MPRVRHHKRGLPDHGTINLLLVPGADKEAAGARVCAASWYPGIVNLTRRARERLNEEPGFRFAQSGVQENDSQSRTTIAKRHPRRTDMHKKESALPSPSARQRTSLSNPLPPSPPTQIRQLAKGPAHDPNETAVGVMRWEGAA
jgi:hypothetical protein